MEEQQPAKQNCIDISKDRPIAFGNFTDQENWDFFFDARRGADDFFEWSHLSYPPEEQSILVPACGNSRLSEHLYDDGFTNITNVDFSKVVISAMLRRNVNERPVMKWRVMDMTDMQFENGTVDAIIDKGGLDALMESELDSRSGILYLSEVKRLLKAGGKYICLTLAEPHVLGLLFRKFRFGWNINLCAIAQKPSSGTAKQLTFMLVAEKCTLTVVSQIIPYMDEYSVESHGYQVQEVFEALERENTVRAEYSTGTDIWCSLDDLKLSVKGDINELEPGRLTDISNFVYQLAPVGTGDVIHIAATSEDDLVDEINERKIVHQVTTALTGTIYVEDVMYDPPEDLIFRRLCFERTESWVHSEVPLSREGPNEFFGQVEDKKVPADFTNWKKGNTQKFDSHSSASSGQPNLEHNFLATVHHQGFIAGLLLFSLHSERTTSAGGLVKTVIIGLGSGTLPTFMRNCLRNLVIEVVELDPVVLNVASEYFGFIEDELLKVHITDATKFLRERANSEEATLYILLCSSGLISPEADFVEESFLLTVKDSLSDRGLFIFKLVTKFSSVRGVVYSTLKRVFSNLYHFYVDRDSIEIIFALKKESPRMSENELAEVCDELSRSLKYIKTTWARGVKVDSRLINPLP
ncbi:hypothetical protein MIMGU_mgv1a020540mg [Erythranthe guttata]|uniref:Methyltransferase type 11 domain-containing protein n=1 Tax=Erythranthe guttata TaxID=4155 RepID=A0A022QVF7_ERYGU|nr:hypothetical protein MIMGU_mgv1a020540mg [Erythranthe guttata]